MKKLLLCLLIVPLPLYAGQIGDKIEYSGYLKTETWIKNYNDERNLSLSSWKNTIDVALQYKMSDDWIFFIHPRYFYDAAYGMRTDFNSYYDKNQEKMGNTQRTEWLRDCYIDYTSPQLDIRMGKQQVVWGMADGVPLLDRVMPFDLSSYWLPDFADIRIPLWMLKMEYSPEIDSTLQFLIIPDFEASRSAPPNAPFAFKSFNDFDTFRNLNASLGGTTDLQLRRPSKQFENSRIGLRWRSMIGSAEYTLNWLYGYSTSAYTYIDSFIPSANPFDPPFVGAYKISRRHKLMQMMGFSFNRSFVEPGPLEGWTVRGEFAYLKDEPTYYGTEGSRQRTELSDKYAYVLGFDKNVFTNWLFSVQFAQFIHEDADWPGNLQVLNAYTYGTTEKIENTVTLKIATDFFHERLQPEVLVIYSDDNEGRISFKTKYELRDNIWLTLGYHHFWGNIWGANGQFRNDDQIVFETKYTF